MVRSGRQRWPNSKSGGIGSGTSASQLANVSSGPRSGVGSQVFAYTRSWTSNGERKQRLRYCISNLPAAVRAAKRLAVLKRGHRQVENGLQYAKAVTLGEDARQTHVGNTADGFARVRNITMSLIRRAGQRDIAAHLRRYSGCPLEALALLGIHVEEHA